jgi:hypothetical protein
MLRNLQSLESKIGLPGPDIISGGVGLWTNFVCANDNFFKIILNYLNGQSQ